MKSNSSTTAILKIKCGFTVTEIGLILRALDEMSQRADTTYDKKQYLELLKKIDIYS